MQANGIEGPSPLTEKYGYLPGAFNASPGNDNIFLELLTTQLQNQNPLEPLDNSEFVQQMTAFASVEEQQALNQNIASLVALQQVVAGQNAFTQSAQLVGKNVTYQDPTTGETGSGFVNGVQLNGDSGLTLDINGTAVPLSLVTGILHDPTVTGGDGAADPETETETDSDTDDSANTDDEETA